MHVYSDDDDDSDPLADIAPAPARHVVCSPLLVSTAQSTSHAQPEPPAELVSSFPLVLLSTVQAADKGDFDDTDDEDPLPVQPVARPNGRPPSTDNSDPKRVASRQSHRGSYQRRKGPTKMKRLTQKLLPGARGADLLRLIKEQTSAKTERDRHNAAVAEGVSSLFKATKEMPGQHRHVSTTMAIVGAKVSPKMMVQEWGATKSQAKASKRTKVLQKAMECSDLVTSKYPKGVKRDKTPQILKQAIGGHIFGLTFAMSGSRNDARCLPIDRHAVYQVTHLYARTYIYTHTRTHTHRTSGTTLGSWSRTCMPGSRTCAPSNGRGTSKTES
jgi:hypothetical protein